MKSIMNVLGIVSIGIMLSVGLGEAQTTSFNDGTCTTASTCGLGGTNQLFDISGSDVFFQESVTIGGQVLNHMIIRSAPDSGAGSVFEQETFTPGGAVTGATTTTSTNALTFRQNLSMTGVDVLVRMDNLNIIDRTGTGVGGTGTLEDASLVGTALNLNQSIVDTAQGLNVNTITLTPDGTTNGFITSINQTVLDPTTAGFSSIIDFDTGTAAVVTQSF